MIGRYIAGVGALVWNPADNTYLLLKRAPDKDFGANVWECVTGRLNQGEGFEEALHREAREEIGVDVVPEFMIGTSHFYRGDPVPENELVGVVYCCSTPTPEAVRLSPEHVAQRWVTATEALALAGDDIPPNRWLRRVIERAEAIRQLLPDELRALYRREGFQTD